MTQETSLDSNVVIKAVVIYGKSGTHNIIPQFIKKFDIYESLVFPGITGNILFNDRQALLERTDITSGSEIHIKYKPEGQAEVSLKYVIYATATSAVPNQVPPMTNSSVSFMSKWAYEGFTRKKSFSFMNKSIDEIVSAIIKECGGTVGEIDKSVQKIERFVTPYWTPIQAIKYLMDFASTKVNGSNTAGHLLWTDYKTGKVNFRVVGNLFDKKNATLSGEITYDTPNPRSVNKSFGMEFEKSGNDLIYGNIGMAQSEFVGFDFDRSKVYSSNKEGKPKVTLSSYVHPHLSSRPPLPTEFENDKYQVIRPSYLYPQTNEFNAKEQDVYNMIAGKVMNKYSMLMSDIYTLTVKVTGESVERAVGKKVKIKFPSGYQGKFADKYMGEYLIRNVRHSIDEYQMYFQHLSLCSDGEFGGTDGGRYIKWAK